MDLLEIIKNKSYKSAATYLRHNPDKRSILLDLTRHIENNFLLNNNELFYMVVNQITEKPKCNCGNFLEYVKPTVGYKLTCGNKDCVSLISSEKRVKTNTIKYGGKAPACSKTVVDKIKQTIKERYNVNNIYDIPNVKQKIIQTNLDRYGVKWSSQSEEIKKSNKENLIKKWGVDCTQKLTFVKEKTVSTSQSRWGVDNNLSSKETREKISRTFNEKYPGGHPMRDPIIKEKVHNTNNQKWGFNIASKSEYIKSKISQTKTKNWLNDMGLMDENFIKKDDDGYYVLFCGVEKKEYKINPVTYNRRKRNKETTSIYLNPLNKYYSKGERELLEFIKTIYSGNTLSNDRSILDSYELDVFLPELNIGFEYNGMYFHSNNFKPKKYHQNKHLKAKEKNVRLIQIWEDEWYNERIKVESYLKHLLKHTKQKIYARNCVVKFIDVNQYKNFCEQNHLQGYSKAKHKIGLFYLDELVSVMSFCTPRVKSKMGFEYEMIRFCNKLNTNVVGSGSKLFKYFIKQIKPESIITYSDLDKFQSNLYENLGFLYGGITTPNLFYYYDNERVNRFNLRKEKVIKNNIDLNKYFKIYGSGNSRWFWFNPDIYK
jgi:hypothetical protein